MNMIQLVLQVCLVAEPTKCKEVTFLGEYNTTQCMHLAPSVIASFSETHPKWEVRRWKCEEAGKFAKI